MTRTHGTAAKGQLRLTLLGAAGALALALPSAGLAIVGAANEAGSVQPSGFDFFTPSSIDPELAARVEEKARERGIRFTPTGAKRSLNERTVTVAVRIDGDVAQAIQTRAAARAVPGKETGLASVQASRFNLGTARGYQSFARPQAVSPLVSAASKPVKVKDLSMPDLAEFEPASPTRVEKPGRLQPRIKIEDQRVAGSSINSLGQQTVDVGGSFRLSPNLDVRAGVRLSQERDRLDPLTDSLSDNQAVYVGTQIRF